MELREPQLLAVIELARQAGKAILSIYQNRDLGVTFKPDVSPLTRADLASHRLIVEGLRKIEPLLPILSEESEALPYEKRKAWDLFWLVDPLDGTKEFISRNGEFTVNIALISRNIPVAGVIHSPVLGLTYYACQGEGAFRQKAGQLPSRIVVDSCSEGRLKIVASRSHRGPTLDRFLQRVGDYECISMGSSLKFCLVADGSAYLYPRLGTTMEWDTAAGQCIVEEAGGKVETLSGARLGYNKPDLRNPHFVVSAGSGYGWQERLNDLCVLE